MWALGLGDKATEPHGHIPSPFAKVITLWIPRRFLIAGGVDLKSFLADVNDTIVRRGLVLWDGQVLTTPITDGIVEGVLRPDIVQCDGQPFIKPIRSGEHTEVIYERGAEGAGFDVPPRRDWHGPQRDFFGLDNPYQMAEDGPEYTWSHVTTRIIGPYLSPDEQIAALIHGERDQYYFYCPCHQAEVVYTTRHRLVCMGCGATHVVLRDPLPVYPKRLLTPEEWVQFFDQNGSRTDEEIGISVVDFQDVENANTIWTTNQWEEAKHRFVFFARSSPQEIADATRGTEADPSIFLEAGWTQVDTPPPPAHQIADDSIDVDLVENAAHSLRDGVASFLRARKNSERLVTAIPQFFRAVELMLKAKLHDLDAHGLDDHPNNPTVLERLAARGILVTKDEGSMVGRLRRLRNDLQHGAAKFNHRTGLTVSRKSIVFLDRFANAELGLWIGDALPADDWYQLLAIAEIASTAEAVVKGRLGEARRWPAAAISSCTRCQRETMVRPDPRTGASCIFCGHVSIYEEGDGELGG
jgi:hypothetical protein